jgi:hypothetical protein
MHSLTVTSDADPSDVADRVAACRPANRLLQDLLVNPTALDKRATALFADDPHGIMRCDLHEGHCDDVGLHLYASIFV